MKEERKFLTDRERTLSEALTKKEAECSELYDMVDNKINQIRELIEENSEAIDLLKRSENWLDTIYDIKDVDNLQIEINNFIDKIEK